MAGKKPKPPADPEVVARLEARRAYGLLFNVMAVLCVLGVFVCILFERPAWPLVPMFFGCLAAGGVLSTSDINAFSGMIKASRGSQ